VKGKLIKKGEDAARALMENELIIIYFRIIIIFEFEKDTIEKISYYNFFRDPILPWVHYNSSLRLQHLHRSLLGWLPAISGQLLELDRSLVPE
jgi:hypothetical protein